MTAQACVMVQTENNKEMYFKAEVFTCLSAGSNSYCASVSLSAVNLRQRFHMETHLFVFHVQLVCLPGAAVHVRL